jgi:uncharacterized membrane protein HdeD (DUF308 family)
MIRLALLLLGPEFIRARWALIALAGALWAALGVAIFIDALKGDRYFPVHVFGYLLILEALVTLVATTSNLGTQTVLRKARGVVFLLVGLLIVDAHHGANLILALVFGLLLGVDGVFRVSAAWVVRFRGWVASLLMGLLEVAFAVFMIEPYPTFYAGTVAYCVGLTLFLSGLGTLLLALRLRALPPGILLATLFARNPRRATLDSGAAPSPRPTGTVTPTVTPDAVPLVVHVWTPTGSAKGALPQPLVDRYIAAVDANGVISTGHAALEVAPDVYISHYPGTEIDHSPEDFRHLLRATADNNVPGRFQPSYEVEAAGWCESTARVVFERYDNERLRAFWAAYRQDDTYNLTNRNCSSTVAVALEAALEGTLGPRPSLRAFLSALANPELWVAAQLRHHAEAMAWTPGLMLDYARALKVAIDPPPLGLVTLTAVITNAARGIRERRALAERIRAQTIAARSKAMAKSTAKVD